MQASVTKLERNHGSVYVMIDTLAIYKNLTGAGIKSNQAEAITKAIVLSSTARLTDFVAKNESEAPLSFSSKANKTTLETATESIVLVIQRTESNLQKSIKATTRDVIQWIVSCQIAMLIALVALAKLEILF